MHTSQVVAGSRFYLPCPYTGPPVLTFRLADSSEYQVKAAEVSCFELLDLPHTLRRFVVLHEFFCSRILLDTKEQVLIAMEGGGRGTEP